MAKKLKYAIVDALDALRKEQPWMGGAAIVRNEEDESLFTAIPGAYLTDISYTGSRRVIVHYNDIYEIIVEGDPSQYTDDEIEQQADFMLPYVQEAADSEEERYNLA